MTQLQRAMVVLLIAVVGIWGCAQGPSTAEKIKALEAKTARLDEDLRAAAAARDQYRKKLNESEHAIAQLKQEIEALQLVVKERDELRVQLKNRTSELAAITSQFDTFRKTLKDLIGQTEAALLHKPAGPTGSTVSLPKGEK